MEVGYNNSEAIRNPHNHLFSRVTEEASIIIVNEMHLRMKIILWGS